MHFKYKSCWILSPVMFICLCSIIHSSQLSICLCAKFVVLSSSNNARSCNRMLPEQRDQNRRCRFVVQGDGSRREPWNVPSNDRYLVAWSRNSVREWRLSYGHQQPTPDGSGEDVDGHHWHIQPGTIKSNTWITFTVVWCRWWTSTISFLYTHILDTCSDINK